MPTKTYSNQIMHALRQREFPLPADDVNDDAATATATTAATTDGDDENGIENENENDDGIDTQESFVQGLVSVLEMRAEAGVRLRKLLLRDCTNVSQADLDVLRGLVDEVDWDGGGGDALDAPSQAGVTVGDDDDDNDDNDDDNDAEGEEDRGDDAGMHIDG